MIEKGFTPLLTDKEVTKMWGRSQAEIGAKWARDFYEERIVNLREPDCSHENATTMEYRCTTCPDCGFLLEMID
jgi:hypothetical protein